MRYDQLIEGRDAPLYHGVRHNHAIKQLQANKIEGRTTQRFWPDGRRLRDDHPDYKNSFWLKGVSTTRTLAYAQNWADVVYVLDQRKLTQRYKVIPFNWGYANAQTRNPNPKRETEEFVVLGKIYKSMERFIEDYNDERDVMWDEYAAAEKKRNREKMDEILAKLKSMPTAMEAWMGPTTSNIEPLDAYLTGIYADKIHETLGAKNIDIITNHPKFIGYF